jgi:selenocysteine lyase/cysteine desulfurase
VIDVDGFQDSFDGEPGYLDWAAFGPLSPAVRSEVHADAELLGTGRQAAMELVGEHVLEARQLLAELMRAERDQIVLQPSTTYGLMQAIYGLAGGLMLSRAEFPSLTVTAQRAANALGSIDLQWLEPTDGFVTPDLLGQWLNENTTAVALSLVDSRTGYRADLSAIREVIGDRLLIVDAMQGFGAIDADYSSADVVCANGYKWLRAGRGTGFAYFSDRALERLRPVLSGWRGTDEQLPMDAVPAPATSAQAFCVTHPDTLAVARLAAALREVRDVGVERIETELLARAQDVMFFADRYDVPVVTPRELERHAGIVTLAPAAADTGALAASLSNHGITVTVRAGQIRVSPHVGTGADTLRLFGDALASFATARVW